MAFAAVDQASYSGDGPTTSAMEQLNANILAQGLTKVPMDLHGLPSRQRDNVLKVISALIERRQDDLFQLESLSTAHKSLTYDYERLAGMHRRLKGDIAAAQREFQVVKVQATALATRLKKEEAAHRVSRDEANKARTALAFVRTQAQYETKKRDVQVDKTMQNWQKITSEHARLLSANITTGLLCLNPVEGSQTGPRVDSFWDPSIKALDQIREGLQEENEAFRHVALSTANKLHRVLATMNGEDPPSLFEPSAFFNDLGTTSTSQVSSSTSHPNAADSKLRSLIGALQSRIEAEFAAAVRNGHADLDGAMDGTKQLQRRVRDLEAELAARLEVAADYTRLLEDFGKTDVVSLWNGDTPKAQTDASDVDLLGEQRNALMTERQQLTEKAVKLGQERAVLEAERRTFAEERRAQQLQDLLADVPDRQPTVLVSRSSEVGLVTGTEELEDLFLVQPGPSNLRSPQPSTTVAAPATKPMISSPLRSSTPHSPRSSERSLRSASISRRRTVKRGPSTPLARLVLQKVTIEKASERKAQKMSHKLEQANCEEGGASPGVALHDLGSNANRMSGVGDGVLSDVKSSAGSTSRAISPGRRKAIIETQKAARTARDGSLSSSQSARAAVLDRASGVGPKAAGAGAGAARNGVWR